MYIGLFPKKLSFNEKLNRNSIWYKVGQKSLKLHLYKIKILKLKYDSIILQFFNITVTFSMLIEPFVLQWLKWHKQKTRHSSNLDP